jgi:N-acetyl-anhydromuramyl-L-alanine amidase AmpD
VCVHTTGSGVYKPRSTPLEVVKRLYTQQQSNFAHYVLDTDGVLVQIADELVRSWHAGIEKADREKYTSGAWKRGLTKTAISIWQKAWPDKKNPLEIVPEVHDPNESYISLEMIPTKGPVAPHKTFTDTQYDVLARWLYDLWGRYGFLQAKGQNDVHYWQAMRSQGRLVGHEDLEPLGRWDSYGGWDPGALRVDPRFAWDYLFTRLANIDAKI